MPGDYKNSCAFILTKSLASYGLLFQLATSLQPSVTDILSKLYFYI